MKKYLKTAAVFAALGLAGGVYYREFSKFFGMAEDYTALAGVHVHFLVLGVLFVLLFGLMEDRLQAPSSKAGFLCYVVGTAGAGAFMTLRGTLQILSKANGIALSAGLNGAVSGMAGLFHITLAVGLFLLFKSWIKACKD